MNAYNGKPTIFKARSPYKIVEYEWKNINFENENWFEQSKKIISEEEAILIFENDIKFTKLRGYYLYKAIMPAYRRIQGFHNRIISPYYDSYAFYIEDKVEPCANEWSRYAFVNVCNGELFTIDNLMQFEDYPNWKYLKLFDESNNSLQNKYRNTENDAINILKEKIYLPDQFEVRMCKALMNGKKGIKKMLPEKKIKSPDFKSYAFFIDDDLNSIWPHPCRYVFINVLNGHFKIIESNSPPNDYESQWKKVLPDTTINSIKIPK